MKTVVKQLKTTMQNNATLSYIKKFEIVSPKLLPDLSMSLIPYIGIAPVSSSESWIAQRKQVVHTVDLYVVDFLQIQESAIIGDTVKPGLLDIVNDVSNIVRGERLPVSGINYLSKPIEITSIDYVVAGYGENVFLLVASMVLQCVRLFNITLPQS